MVVLGGRAVVNRHVALSVQSWTAFSLALAMSLWQLKAQPFQGVSDGSPIIVNHNAGSGPPESLALQTQRPLSTFGSHSVSKLATTIFGLPSLVVETHHREASTHHSAYGFLQDENFLLPLRDSPSQPR